MRKRNNKTSDWEKPRYNRSRLKIVKISSKYNDKHHGTLSQDKCLRGSSMSDDTFEEMVERGLLTQEQIDSHNAQKNLKNKGKRKSKFKAKAKYSREELIAEIAGCDLNTMEGLNDFKKIVIKHPEAINFIAEARKLKANG